MALRIEDYALIGDTESCALVGLDGSIDWLCLPRFDSEACFTALLGTEDHGAWRMSPVEEVRSRSRRYVGDSLILETELQTDSGCVVLTDWMPPRDEQPNVLRRVRCTKGRVAMRSCARIRFGFGSRTPWVRVKGDCITAKAGPDAVQLRASVPIEARGFDLHSDFTLSEGEEATFVLTWHPSHEPARSPLDPDEELERTARYWTDWAKICTYQGPYREAVLRSLITLKALTYSPTGGIVAAATTSLPEQIGGPRNWDYRICWLRDATLTLKALMDFGYLEEARAWKDWLLRAIAGEPKELQVMYGLAGERRLTEIELHWLPGYENSAPVRMGNDAYRQLQLDVFGEVLECLASARAGGINVDEEAWDIQKGLLAFVLDNWNEPDEGIWEVRGGKQHFTHSKVMLWVALDCGIRAVDENGFDGPVERWRELRDQIHAEVCERGYDPAQNAFIQRYGATHMDASLLMIPQVGFLPPDDPRVAGTIAAIEKTLMEDGLVHRYDSHAASDGLPPGEGAFLACSFWLADAYLLTGRREQAVEIFERVLSLRNDVGLLAEEYDPSRQRLLGNFPQAFSHVALLHTALLLAGEPTYRVARHSSRDILREHP